MRHLNQDTLIPIGLAILVIGGATSWISGVSNTLSAQSEVIVELRRNNEDNIKLVTEINSRLSRIEWKLEKKP